MGYDAAECDVEVCEAKAGRKVRWCVMGHGRWSEEVDEVGGRGGGVCVGESVREGGSVARGGCGVR